MDNLLGEVDGDDGGGAAHTSQVVRHDVVLELEVVHHSGGQRRHGVEGRAMADDSINLRKEQSPVRRRVTCAYHISRKKTIPLHYIPVLAIHFFP